jgi:hypothetical protein
LESFKYKKCFISKHKSPRFYLKVIFLLLFCFYNCTVSDPNYLKKTLLNVSHTGFISRDFFQVVVEIPILTSELTILKEREWCIQKALQERDRVTIPLLRSIAGASLKNKNKEFTSIRSYKSFSKNFQTSRGEFSWFLDSMFIFQEDYSSRDKCKFVYRNIQDNLYSKVEDIYLVVPEDTKREKSKYIDPSAPATQQTPGQTNTNPITPGVIR